MKIGLVCPYDIFRSGGVQEHVLAQAAELRRRGHKVKIITPRPRKYSQATPADVIFVGNSALVKTPIKTSLELGISMGRTTVDDMLAAEAFDVLHVHEPEVPVLGAQIIAKAGCPVVATFHAFYPDTAMARTLESLRIPYSKSIFSRLSAITAVSDVAAVFVREHAKQKVHIIPNGIDLKKYNPKVQRVKRQKATILYIGRLEKRKGTRYLLKAFTQLQRLHPEAQLLIAGDGPERPRLEEQTRRLGSHHVTFLGFIDEDLKLELLASATVFCSPALYGESFGIVLLEAMAMGAVTVAADNPGYATVLTGAGRSSLVDPKNTREFAGKLEMFFKDPLARQKWQAWAAKNIQRYNYQKIVDDYEALYETL